MADEYISGVVSLLHFNGANGSTSFKDSATALNWTATGDAVISTDQSKIGDSAYYKPTAGNNYLTTPTTPDLNMRGCDFTVELWVYPLSMAQYNFPIAKVELSNHNNFRIGYEGNGALYVHCSGTGNAAPTPANTIVVNQWQHMALTRMGSTARVFVDGVLKGTWTDAADMNNDTPVFIGADGNGWNGFTGYIDEVRITKGQCRYVSDFTPQTTPFDNPPQWWNAAPNLTPVAAWDASRKSGNQLLDGVGANNLIADSNVTDTVEYPNKGVFFNSAAMTTPIPVPHGAGVVAGWISNYENSGFGVIGTGQYQTMYFEGVEFWMDNYARVMFSSYVGKRDKPQFAAFVFKGESAELYLDGQIVGSTSGGYLYIMNYVLGSINMMQGNVKKYFHALAILTGNATLEDLQKLENAARLKLRYGGNTTYRGFAAPIGRTDSNLPQLTLSTPAPQRFVGATLTRRDYQFGGNGRIAGTVKEKGTPDQPLKRRVQLYDETSKIMTREVWSDPNTGAYLFENIDPKLTYSIISYDYTGMYRAVIANGQKATT